MCEQNDLLEQFKMFEERFDDMSFEPFEEVSKIKNRLNYIEENIEKLYDEMLDDCNQPVKAGYGKFWSYSRVLYRMDETAYRCGMVDYESFLTDDLNNELNYHKDDLRDVLQDLEVLLSDLEEFFKLEKVNFLNDDGSLLKAKINKLIETIEEEL